MSIISPQKVLRNYRIYSKKGKCPEVEYHTPRKATVHWFLVYVILTKSFEKVDLRKNLYNFLTVFQRLEYHQRHRPKRKKNDILKERTAFIRNIDYAGLCDYSIANLLKHKHKKSELVTVIREPFSASKSNSKISQIENLQRYGKTFVEHFYWTCKWLCKNRYFLFIYA